MVCALWSYAYIIKAKEDMIFGVPFSKFITCSGASVILMLLTGMVNALFYAFVLFSLIGLPHMSLHTLPAAADAIDALEIETFQTETLSFA